MFGTAGGRNRTDMSSYLIHLTQEGDTETISYDNIMSILYQGKLMANPFGVGRARFAEQHKSVCFTETPLGDLHQLRRRRSPYGIAFHKVLAERSGARRVWYLPEGRSEAQAIAAMMQASTDPNDPIWKLTPFVDFTRTRNAWDWEREWRHPGDFLFDPQDVAFLLIPRMWHEQARAYFNSAEAENTGPNYTCIYFDADWTQEEAREAYAAFKRRCRQERTIMP